MRRTPRARLGTLLLEDRLTPTGGFDPTPAVSYQLQNDWGGGFQAQLSLTNDQSSAISDWRLSFDYGRQIDQMWNASVLSQTGTRYELGPAAYNATLSSGGSVQIGFLGTGGTASQQPGGYYLSWGDAVGPTPGPGPGTVAATATFRIANSWFGGFIGEITVTNTGTEAITNWQLAFDFNHGVGSLWNGRVISQTGTRFVIGHAGYNSTIPAGQSVVIGFVGTAAGAVTPPANYALNGVNLTGPTPPPVLPNLTVTDGTVTEPTQTVTAASGFFSTSGNQIVDSAGQSVRIAGVNWFGMETNTFAPHGLWARGYKSMMDQMKSLNFNTIRLPFSNQLFDADSTPNGINFSLNPDLQGLNGLQIMDKIVAYAGEIGLRILLDNHRSDAGGGPNGSGLWYTAAYPETRWISDWTMLAARYANNPAVIGADLHNEPHGQATWGSGSLTTDWRLAAQRAGNAILAVNPNWLIVVEGIDTGPSGNYWWGGNLSAAAQYPVQLSVADRLVYSPHDYPSTVYPQPWFSAANYPNNLPAVWTANWGYLYQQNVAPILLGEFGTKYQTTSDQQWLAALVNYLGASAPAGQPQGPSWTYWSWNPNSGDTGGILADDWQTVQTPKLNAIAPMQFTLPTAGGGDGPTTVQLPFTVRLSQAASTSVTVNYATIDGTAKAGQDYSATSGKLTFAPGQTELTVLVTVLADTEAEGDETFTLRLSGPGGATLFDADGVGTIRDA